VSHRGRDERDRLCEALQRSRHVVVLTGAGMSTESGLPDFRSKGGLWDGVDPMELASIRALRRDPARFYRFYEQRLAGLASAEPNEGHRALAALEGAGIVSSIVTQNVDGLHQAAGSTNVIEVHGNLRSASCVGCGERYPIRVLRDAVRAGTLPRCGRCADLLKPDVVLFGEMLPEGAMRAAVREAERCDLMLVVGSSLVVAPVSQLPGTALAGRAHLAIVNLEETGYDRFARVVVRGYAGETLAYVASRLVPPGRGG